MTQFKHPIKTQGKSPEPMGCLLRPPACIIISSRIITLGGSSQKLQLVQFTLEITLPLQNFTMVDAFCATWKLVDSENFDEYMKALGG